MFGIGTTEFLILAFILVLIFGSAKIPQLGQGIGQGIRNFKKAMKEPDAIDVTPQKKSDAPEANQSPTSSEDTHAKAS